MTVAAFLIAGLVVIVTYFKWVHGYWARKGVISLPGSFFLGNVNTVLPRGNTLGTLAKVFHDKFKELGCKFGGVYLVTEPNLVVVDPEYVKDILTKDFQHFVDRGFYHNEKDDPLSAHLFAVDGSRWKNLRNKLTPTFTSGKMKMMFHSVVECSDYMVEAVEKSTTNGEDIDVKEVLGRFTTDVIGTCAFGINCNSFKYPDAEFRQIGKRIFYFNLWDSLKAFFYVNMPDLSRKLHIKSTKKDVEDFMLRTVKHTMKIRDEQGINRGDFLQILIDGHKKGIFTIEEIASQVFLFFVAGFDTSSTAMAFALYELARHPDIQTRLRSEILDVLARHDGEITYESLNEMTYLSQVLDETLRLYPSVPTINRRCTKDYTLKNTEITIEKGTPVLISNLALHTDPEYFPEPEKFNPERFSEENKRNITPFTYLPFGDGQRNCIGLRFGVMQSKIGIIQIVKNFKLTVSPKTGVVELDPDVFLLAPVKPIYLKAEKV